MGGIPQPVCRNEVEPGFIKHSLGDFGVGSFKSYNDRKVQINFFRSFNNTSGYTVATYDPAENVDKNSPDVFIAHNDFKAFFYGLRTGTAADVKEVCRFSAGKLNHVHRCHRQSCAVYHTADITVEPDVIEV